MGQGVLSTPDSARWPCPGRKGFLRTRVQHRSEGSPVRTLGSSHWLYLSLRINTPEGDFHIIINTCLKGANTFQNVPHVKDCPDKRGEQVVSRVNLRHPTRWPAVWEGWAASPRGLASRGKAPPAPARSPPVGNPSVGSLAALLSF